MIHRMLAQLLTVALVLILTATAARALNNNDFLYIPPGTFTMGDNDSNASYSKPEHAVAMTGFLMYSHEITQKEWFDVMGTKPWLTENPEPPFYYMEGDNYPAVYISWEDAVAFITSLNTGLSQQPYSLPSEAQWEYACRAGTTTHFSFGDYNAANPNMALILNAFLWYRENAWIDGQGYARVVKQKKPNGFGLYDMHGNVWEWCLDNLASYSVSFQTDPVVTVTGDLCKVIRGGAVDEPAFQDLNFDCTSAFRTCKTKTIGDFNIGFRVVRKLTGLDFDGDGRADNADNCPTTANADQLDLDRNGIGDACEVQPSNIGDLNGNDAIELTDAILAGQVLAGTAPTMQFDPEKDPGEDNKIGLEDLIFILQTIGGVR